MAQGPISFADASQSLLDAAVDPSRWQNAMEAIAQYADATGTVLLQVKGRGPGTPHSRSLDEIYDVYFRDQWHLRDERNRGLPFIKTKGIFVDQDFASRDELESSDYYPGFLAKFDANWSAVIGFSNADDEWCLIVQRGDKKGFYDSREQSDLVRLAPYLNQAALLARNLAYANATGMIDAYESVGCACFLLDHFGKVIKHNAQAQSILGDGLDLSQRTVKCASPLDSLALANLIAGIRQNTAQNATNPAPFVLAHRPPKRPLIIQAICLSGLTAAIFSPAKSILLVSDPEKRPAAAPPDLLKKLFNLTLTEVVLLSHLDQEVTLPAAAEIMGISFETARSHLKHIFSKTGTNRQSDLLMLIRRIHRQRIGGRPDTA
jgi:DNA-binding CsgD family transcriptional regulator